MRVIRSKPLPSLCPVPGRDPRLVSVGLVQTRWYECTETHQAQIHDGVSSCAAAGANVVFLPELTLSRYPADRPPSGNADETAEDIASGESVMLAQQLARECDVHIQISLFERSGASDNRGLNTSVIVAPSGTVVGFTRKLHIPVTEGYFEDHYFAEGPATDPYPVHTLGLDGQDLNVGNPTCWDEWFPEVPRCYALAGADLLCYPTAIGSEPDYPDFDTAPLLRQVISGHAIANGLFIAIPNRYGAEGLLTFYGGSCLIDPFGRVIVEAPRDEAVALVAEIDLGQREDWLTLFPFFATRRPDTYSALTESRVNPRKPNGKARDGGIPGIAP
ncbi:MAG: nitrilase-related carbon-nitrogen hydrolase [Luminiphilus sp.]|nr:nitrilase-related carbon-nitrogen hydrolase [Luminiphilus sp.]